MQRTHLIACLFLLSLYSEGVLSMRFRSSRAAGRASELTSGPCERGGLSLAQNAPTKFCYFDKSTPCSGSSRCPFDERPCAADRGYFDHVYGANKSGDAKATSNLRPPRSESGEDSKDTGGTDPPSAPFQPENSQFMVEYRRLSRKERRLRRKKLFLMSTWLEDLLPDPHQGRTWVVNAVVDMLKISFRATAVLLSLVKVVPPPKIFSSD